MKANLKRKETKGASTFNIFESEFPSRKNFSCMSNRLIKILGESYPNPVTKSKILEKLYGIQLEEVSDRYKAAIHLSLNKLMSRTRQRLLRVQQSPLSDLTSQNCPNLARTDKTDNPNANSYQVQIACVKRGSESAYRLLRVSTAETLWERFGSSSPNISH